MSRILIRLPSTSDGRPYSVPASAPWVSCTRLPWTVLLTPLGKDRRHTAKPFPRSAKHGTAQTFPATRHHTHRIRRPRPLRHPDGRIHLDENLTDGIQCWGDGRALMFSGPLDRARRIVRKTNARLVRTGELRRWLGGGSPHPTLDDFPTAALLAPSAEVATPLDQQPQGSLRPAAQICRMLPGNDETNRDPVPRSGVGC